MDNKQLQLGADCSEFSLDKIWNWNQHLPTTITECVHDQIINLAKVHPDRQAVTSWDGDLTYGQLDEYSAVLAAYLLNHGAGFGEIIPLCFNKSIWSIVSLLGVLRSGSTVTMTDPSQPEQRLAAIAEQVNAKLVLTSVMCQEKGKAFAPQITVIPIDQGFFGRNSNIPKVALPTVSPDQTMYVIFTSGSTGKPKGVMISHMNFASGAVPRAKAVGYRPHSRVLDFPSYAFDVSYDCMLCTLTNGGCICVPSDHQRINDLSDAIRSMKVNMAHMTPSVARLLDHDIVPSLEVLGVGGEPLSLRDTSSWTATTKVVNAYGPSECTVGCTINNNISPSTSYITIGKGCGSCTWICDPEDHSKLTSYGEMGELLIEGPIVGQGYLGDPGKTAEVFIENPSWLICGFRKYAGRTGRLYKTGDLVKYDEHGALIFVGRKDQQVKIRGQRVELGEIEHHLGMALPRGLSVAAEVIKPAGGEPVMVAFLSNKTSASIEFDIDFLPLSTELVEQLQIAQMKLEMILPSYMVPTAYVSLSVLPLLVSLKTDRKRLRQMGEKLSRQDLATFNTTSLARKVANSGMEARLRKYWDAIFSIDTQNEKIDNFFALGGDSLKAMRLVSLAKEDSISLSVSQILRNPCLADMASVAKEIGRAKVADIKEFSMFPDGLAESAIRSLAALSCGVAPEEIADIYPCTPLQEGLMALSSKVAEAYVSQRVVKLRNDDIAQRLKNAFQTAEQHCDVLRTRIIQVTDHGLFQVVLKSGESWTHDSNLDQYLMLDRTKHMGLAQPLVRYGIVRDTLTDEVDFVLTMHHALYDGWSMPLIVDVINRAYHNQSLPKLPSFRYFIHYLCIMDTESSHRYWRSNLAGVNALQFPRSPNSNHQAKSDSLLEHHIIWDKSSRMGTNLANVIRGAWALVASDYCGSNDVVIGETLTGRNAPVDDIEQIAAPLITTVPLRIQIARHMTTTEFLQIVQEQTVDRIPHEHLGLQNIRRLSTDARNACELRTGLVIHPHIDEDISHSKSSPANNLVPAGDIEAAREALKFNSYNLMLVCTQDEKGFLTMASFDSRAVSVNIMKQALVKFDQAVQFLTNTRKTLTEYDASEKHTIRFSQPLLPQSVDNMAIGEYSEVHKALFKSPNAMWIVHSDDLSRILPPGAVGELVLEHQSGCLGAETLILPDSLVFRNHTSHNSRLYKSGYLAVCEHDGLVHILGLTQNVRQSDAKKAKQSNKLKEKDEPTSLSDTGKVLRHCWSKLLKVDENDISLQDNFFELGGDSIVAMRLVSDLRSQGFMLTVANIFSNDNFGDMVLAIQSIQQVPLQRDDYVAFSSLSCKFEPSISINRLQSLLVDPGLNIVDAYPALPLQTIAVDGTINLPRFSVRYELFHFSSVITKEKLFDACRLLIEANEILRTTFVSIQDIYVGVVLQSCPFQINQYDIDGQINLFCSQLCDLDAQTKIRLGSQLVKFFYVQESGGKSSLIMRISHAQYDEVCLPNLLQQFVQFYKSQDQAPTIAFSRYVHHIIKEVNQSTVSYWKDLLRGSSMTTLNPNTPITLREHFAISRKFNISKRPKAITVATLPTATWALCMARKLSLRDVTFGEVVDGRNISFPDAETVMGPCWQYIPVRVKFAPYWTGLDLLNAVQQQHARSGRHASMGLEEIVENCTDWPRDTTWFDTVVHQDVAHVETFDFTTADCRLETIYPHEEPLREWKIQAFHDGDNLTIEVVTFESWKQEAAILLEEIGESLSDLINACHRELFSLADNASGAAI